MRSIRQILFMRTRAALGLLVLAGLGAVGAVGCRRETVPCVPAPLVDTAGESGEAARIRFQWLSIQGKLDSVQATAGGIRDMRDMPLRFDSAIARYADSLRTEGGVVTSRSGCVDWRATWDGGRVDRAALATAWLRQIQPQAGGVVEWEVADPTGPAMGLTLRFTRPGADGGTLDSMGVRLFPDRVEVGPVPEPARP